MATSGKAKISNQERYARRTGMTSRAATILAKAVITKSETIEDEEGNVIRLWQPSECNSYSNADLKLCLSNRVAVERNDMLGTVPPSAIKYCVARGWLVPVRRNSTLFYVTLRAAIALDLPLYFKGGSNHGRKIKFVA